MINVIGRSSSAARRAMSVASSVKARAGHCRCRDVYCAVLRSYLGMLQSCTTVFEVKYLVGCAADRDHGRFDDAVVLLLAAGRIPGDESNQDFHGITSR